MSGAPNETWVVDGRLGDLDGLAYAKRFLDVLDGSALERVRARYHDRTLRYREPGFWGYCYGPTKTVAGYRVSVFACGEDHNFPLGTAIWRRKQKPGYRPGAYATHAGILNCEYVVRGLGAGLVWILGHELFHYAAATGQTDLPADERTADLVGYELLWSYREAEGPAPVADALRSADGSDPVAEVSRRAPNRWPYAVSGREWG